MSLFRFLNYELRRGYALEQDQQRYEQRREKMYTFMRIPKEVEKFVAYGFLQCTDSFLFLFTFLPIRVIAALCALITRPISRTLKIGSQVGQTGRILYPAEIWDLIKCCIMLICSYLLSYVDTSVLYHVIKSQSVIKLYIFFNMLEVGDRLFSVFGQDSLDTLLWTATQKRDKKREHMGVIPHLIFAIVYVFTHTLLILCQATTLNVAVNSNNKALLTIMMSNNFVELKSMVFKKFDKNNLFQLACSDVRERVHYCVLLFAVVMQTMKEYSWQEDRFWILAPDCILILISEFLVDWVKHAFITRFNDLPVELYREYTFSLAYDFVRCHGREAFSDHADLMSRRMGFIPIPLGVLLIRVVWHSVTLMNTSAYIVAVMCFLCLMSCRILNGIFISGKACELVERHQKELLEKHQRESEQQVPKETRVNQLKSFSHPPSREISRSDITNIGIESNHPANFSKLEPQPMFVNSTVSITSQGLNEYIVSEGSVLVSNRRRGNSGMSETWEDAHSDGCIQESSSDASDDEGIKNRRRSTPIITRTNVEQLRP